MTTKTGRVTVRRLDAAADTLGALLYDDTEALDGQQRDDLSRVRHLLERIAEIRRAP